MEHGQHWYFSASSELTKTCLLGTLKRLLEVLISNVTSTTPYTKSNCRPSLCSSTASLLFYTRASINCFHLQRIRLQLLQPTSSISLNLTLFHLSSDTKSIGKLIVTSGPYSDAISGVVTPQVSLNPGKYLLVPSTYRPAVQVGFRLSAYCSTGNVNITMRTPRTR